MSDHTPTPWGLDDAPDSNYGCQIAADTKVKAKRIVCRLGGPDHEANSAFIVKAVNNHARMVEALKRAEELYLVGLLNAPDGLAQEVVNLRRAILTDLIRPGT